MTQAQFDTLLFGAPRRGWTLIVTGLRNGLSWRGRFASLEAADGAMRLVMAHNPGACASVHAD